MNQDITKDQEKMLKTLRVRAGKKEETQIKAWRDVYKILYPHVPDDLIPSPCTYAILTYHEIAYMWARL